METILNTLLLPFFDGSIFGPHPTERGLSIWMGVKVMGVILPTLFVVSWIWTVSALHRRGVYFWTLASTWVIPPVGIACLLLASISVMHADNAPNFVVPLYAAGVLEVTVLFWAFFYNVRYTGSVVLALFTLLLQHLGLLGLFWFMFVRGGACHESH
jgi:hypothetical protein